MADDCESLRQTSTVGIFSPPITDVAVQRPTGSCDGTRSRAFSRNLKVIPIACGTAFDLPLPNSQAQRQMMTHALRRLVLVVSVAQIVAPQAAVAQRLLPQPPQTCGSSTGPSTVAARAGKSVRRPTVSRRRPRRQRAASSGRWRSPKSSTARRSIRPSSPRASTGTLAAAHPPSTTGKEHYLSSQVQVSNGTAKLVAEPLSPAVADSACYQGRCTYKAGLVSTARPRADNGSPYLFTFTYGYIESRMKFPGTPGFFTAFWMLPADPSFNYRTEIDIVEILGGVPDTIFMTLSLQQSQLVLHAQQRVAQQRRVSRSKTTRRTG